MKRILTIVLCIVMVITAAAAFADELKLSTKLERQIQHDGNGEKGKLIVTGNADSAEYPVINGILLFIRRKRMMKEKNCASSTKPNFTAVRHPCSSGVIFFRTKYSSFRKKYR